jgi:formyltetrahydrofolate hydrolase
VKRIGRFVLVPGRIELNIQLMKANKRAALLISRQVHALDVLLVFEQLEAFGVEFVSVLSADVCPAKAAASLDPAFAGDEH